MVRLAYVNQENVKVPVDNYGRPFKTKEDQKGFEHRENDPEYSLIWSQADYKEAVDDLSELASDHRASNYEGAIEFNGALRDAVARIEDCLKQVQFDILRVAEKNTPGFIKPIELARAHRRTSLRRVGTPYSGGYHSLIGEVTVEDENSEDDWNSL